MSTDQHGYKSLHSYLCSWTGILGFGVWVLFILIKNREYLVYFDHWQNLLVYRPQNLESLRIFSSNKQYILWIIRGLSCIRYVVDIFGVGLILTVYSAYIWIHIRTLEICTTTGINLSFSFFCAEKNRESLSMPKN